MKKRILCLLAFALLANVCGRVSAQNVATGSAGNDIAVDRLDPAGVSVSGIDSWKATVYGPDWVAENERLCTVVPGFAPDLPIAATASDSSNLASMHDETLQKIEKAVENYYLLLDKVTSGHAGQKFSITAARAVEGYILIWVDEPGIMDGGRALVYSCEKGKIIAAFWDGGIRG